MSPESIDSINKGYSVVIADKTNSKNASSPLRNNKTEEHSKHVKAHTPERKTSRQTRPKPSFLKKRANISHIGNTLVSDEKPQESSPVPAPPKMGKFRKRLNLCLSPLTESSHDTHSSPEQTTPESKNTDIASESLNLSEESALVSTVDNPLAETIIEHEDLSPRGGHCPSIIDIDIMVDVENAKPNIKPSRPSMPPSIKTSRPKPKMRNMSLDRSRRREISSADIIEGGKEAEAKVFEKLKKSKDPVEDIKITRMKFVPMPKRKLHKVERIKFNPRLENINEHEEHAHKIPRWLTIFRKRWNEGSQRRPSKKKQHSEPNIDCCDNSLLSSTVVLVNDGVEMDGVNPDDEKHGDIQRVHLSGLEEILNKENEAEQDDEYRRKLGSYFNAPDGLEQVEDYEGFECIFNRYGANLKNYVEDHRDINTVLDACGNNLLHAAAYIGWERAVKFLIRRGVSVNCTNNYGVTPLAYAIEFEYYTIRDYLLKKGAKVSV